MGDLDSYNRWSQQQRGKNYDLEGGFNRQEGRQGGYSPSPPVRDASAVPAAGRQPSDSYQNYGDIQPGYTPSPSQSIRNQQQLNNFYPGENNAHGSAPNGSGNRGTRRSRQLTFEENKVLKECSREAKFYSGLPLVALSVGGMIFLKNRGFVQPKRFWIKTGFLAAGSYFFGSSLYAVSVCRERILREIPQSQLAQDIRKLYKTRESPFAAAEVAQEVGGESLGSSGGESRFQHDETNYPGMIMESPDYHQSQKDQLLMEENQSSPTTTYDELRRRHRDEFVRNMRPPPGFPSTPSQPTTPTPAQHHRERPYVGKYGDAGFLP